jgi:hypothetical protein
MSSPNSFDGAAQSEERYLPTALFFALQGVGPYVFIDREELRIRQTKSENGEAFARYASDPGRYVPVRAFSPRVVSQLTLEALQGLLPEEELWGLPSDDPRWGAQLLGRLAPDARALAKREFTAVLVRLAESWLAEMNLPSEGLILAATAPRDKAKDTSAKDTSHTHPAPRDTVTPAALRVRDPRLFNAALQDRQDKGLFLHLTTLKLVEAPIGPEGAGPPVSDEEWSWLRVPPIPTQWQIEHAIHHLSPERREELGPRLIAAGHQWSAVVARALTDAELKQFNTARTALVVIHLSSWMTTHQLPIDKYIGPDRQHSPREAPIRSPQASPAASSDTLTALRVRLHTIIDQMSLEELSALPIPARCLLL